MRRDFFKKLGLATLALTLSASTLSANPQNWPKEINFGVIPVAGATSMKDTFGGLTKYLESKLGIKVNLQTAGDYAGVITAMQHNHVQLAYFGPKSYVEAHKRAKAEAIVIDVDAESGLPGYYGMIITKKGSGLKTLEDIKGKTWAFTDTNSTSGTLVPSVMFSKKGINPQEYFSKVLYSGGHEASILSVKAGKVDAASTNNLDFNRGLGRNWKKDDFNVIWESSLIPGAPMAVRSDLPESLKMAIKGAFISYNDVEGLKKLKLKGYAATDDSQYDSVRDLIELKKSLKK
ncbi:phosphonate ABC transporter substrate-binding protein [Arcobacter sp. KX21116]|jgi:phosphonate transport system substrate-binding protein|uniref:phosphonate ABC transporter substrate-binding protein n=1 Tax=Arcobacter iocasae TaxID=2906515 RepID=UPI0035D44DD6